MNRCIGFPYCTEEIEENQISCGKCWRKMPTNLRNEFLAAKRNFKGTVLYNELKQKLEEKLHGRLRYGLKRLEIREKYTIVR